MTEPATNPEPRRRGPGKPKPVLVDSGWQVYGFDERCGRRWRLEQRTIRFGHASQTERRRVDIGRL